MKKYLCDVYLPTIGKHYDVYLPASKQVAEATDLLAGIAESLSSFKSTPDTVLINAETGELLPRLSTVYDAGIRNSSKLILV